MTVSARVQALAEPLLSAINQEIRLEAQRIKTAARFLPISRPAAEARIVPTEAILHSGERFFIDEAPVVALLEIWVEFALTRQQVGREAELGTARTLAVRAANLLAQAEDAVIYQGGGAFANQCFFSDGRVFTRSGPPATGLLEASVPPAHRIEIPLSPDFKAGEPLRYGENTYEAIARGYEALQAADHEGPYAVILPPAPYADTQAALPETDLRPAERIKALLHTQLYGTNNLPSTTGLLVSVGGSSMDLALGQEPELDFLFEDNEGKFRFRVWERFVLRLRDESAVVKLEFMTEPTQ